MKAFRAVKCAWQILDNIVNATSLLVVMCEHEVSYQFNVVQSLIPLLPGKV